MTPRQKEILDAYLSGLTLREAAAKLEVSLQRVHQVVVKFSPESLRPAHIRYKTNPKK